MEMFWESGLTVISIFLEIRQSMRMQPMNLVKE